MTAIRNVCLFCVFTCAAASARAQSAPVLTLDRYESIGEAAVGVSLQDPPNVNQPPLCHEPGVPCLSPPTFLGLGFALSAGVHPTDLVAIVGELSAYPDDWASDQPGCDHVHSVCAINRPNRVSAALAGLKLRTPVVTGWSSHGRFFAQAMVGPEWSDVAPRQRVFQPGVGYDAYLRNGVWIRFEYDYRFAGNAVRDLSTSRVAAWIAAPLGGR